VVVATIIFQGKRGKRMLIELAVLGGGNGRALAEVEA